MKRRVKKLNKLSKRLGELNMKTKTQKTAKAIGNIIIWGVLLWGSFHLLKWILEPSIQEDAIIGFLAGATSCFLVITYYGLQLQKRVHREEQMAKDAFMQEQAFEKEKQAKLDEAMIQKLRQEHELSGHEQDKRLRALEQALKHLKGKR